MGIRGSGGNISPCSMLVTLQAHSIGTLTQSQTQVSLVLHLLFLGKLQCETRSCKETCHAGMQGGGARVAVADFETGSHNGAGCGKV